MNCISEVQRIEGLKPRRRKGLRRPTKEVPGLGMIEYVREERCHTWQYSHAFVPTRLTLIDGILAEQEEPHLAVDRLASLLALERRIRLGAVRARYFEFVDAAARLPAFDEIEAHLDDWAAPYRIERWSDASYVFKYDCSDSPGGRLIGSLQFQVSADEAETIDEVRYYTSGLADEWKIAAFRQRIQPPSFVMDCIADQFIGTTYLQQPTDELARLLEESIEQTQAMLQKTSGAEATFLRCAHSLLCERRSLFSEQS